MVFTLNFLPVCEILCMSVKSRLLALAGSDRAATSRLGRLLEIFQSLRRLKIVQSFKMLKFNKARVSFFCFQFEVMIYS